MNVDSNHRFGTPRLYPIFETAFVALAGILFFLLTLSQNLSIAHDSAWYLNSIDRGELLFHPHHLFYNYTAYFWLQIARWLGIRASSALIVQLLNVVFGGLLLATLYRIFRDRMGRNPLSAAIALLPVMLSYGIWLYSTIIETYIIPLCLLLTAFYYLTEEKLRPRNLILASLAMGFATLFHQMNILFGIVILIYLWYRRRTGTVMPRQLWTYLGIGLAAVVIAVPYLYIIVTVLKLNTFQSAWFWVTSYAHDTMYWNKPSLGTLMKIAMGLFRCLFGGQFLIRVTETTPLSNRINHRFALEDDSFLVHDLSYSTSWILFTLTVAAMGWGLFTLYRFIRSQKDLPASVRPVMVLALIWLVVYSLFFSTWDPANLEFWIPQSVCIWLFILSGFWYSNRKSHSVSRENVSLALLALMIGFVNYTGSIKWLTNRNYDYYWVKVTPISEVARPGDLIVTFEEWMVADYFRHESAASVSSVSGTFIAHPNIEEGVADLAHRIGSTLSRGGTVFVTQDAVVINDYNVQRLGAGIRSYERLWDPYRTSWSTRTTVIDTIYTIPPTPLLPGTPEHIGS